jgi:hypothetical protein
VIVAVGAGEGVGVGRGVGESVGDGGARVGVDWLDGAQAESTSRKVKNAAIFFIA